MSDTKELLQHARREFPPPEGVMESLRRRRDRKRRNQRIAAGVVGIAVFVAAIWIVTSVSSLDRSETSVVPGGDVTGPAETGPAETGPTAYGFRIPPAGTAVSTPVEGELIAEAFIGFAGHLRVYADGRVLSAESSGAIIVERRLSPEGVELVRQVLGDRVHLGYGPGAVRLESLLGYPGLYSGDIRQSAWEDREGKPWVPARYGACFGWPLDIPLDVEAVLNQLPASAQALLRGSDPAAWPRCLVVVTPEQARSLEEILSEALAHPAEIHLSEWKVGEWSLRDGNGDQLISVRPLFPDGRPLFGPGY